MPDSARYASAVLIYLALPATVAGWLLADAHEVPAPIGAVLGYAVYQLVVSLLLVPLLVRVFSEPCSEPRRGRLVALGEAMAVPVRDVRMLPARRGAFLGVGAYSIVPNRVHLVLAEGVTVLSPAELDAAVAHQLGRARSRAWQATFLVGLAVWAGLALSLGWLVGNRSNDVTITLLAFLGAVFVQTYCRLVGERQADRHAAAVIGARPLADALERRHRRGGIYPPGFSLWLLLTYPLHLSDDRLASLRGQPTDRPQP
jgi:Zn-dependent protease with chaperone function